MGRGLTGRARGRHRRRPTRSFRDQRLLLAMSLGAALAAGLTNSPQASTAQLAPIPVAVAPPPVPPAQVVTPPPPPLEPVVKLAAKPPRRTLVVTGRQGLRPNAVKLLQWMDSGYPELREVGGVRPCDRYAEHCSGVALDAMTHGNMGLGDRIARDALKLPYVRYVIWKQQMLYPDGRVMRMPDRGSPNENHFTHVHIRVTS